MHFDQTSPSYLNKKSAHTLQKSFDKEMNSKNIHWKPLMSQHSVTALTFPHQCYLSMLFTTTILPTKAKTTEEIPLSGFRSKREQICWPPAFLCTWTVDSSRLTVLWQSNRICEQDYYATTTPGSQKMSGVTPQVNPLWASGQPSIPYI